MYYRINIQKIEILRIKDNPFVNSAIIFLSRNQKNIIFTLINYRR